MRRIAGGFVLLVACSASPSPRGSLPSPPVATSATVASTRPAFEFTAEPTPELLGAPECKKIDHELGDGLAIGSVLEVNLGFGPEGGLAVWDGPDRSLSLRHVDLAGAPLGPPSTMTLHPKEGLPRIEKIAAIEHGFVVIANVGAWAHSHYVAVVTDVDGKPRGAPIDLDLDLKDIADVISLGPHELGVLAMGALVTEDWEREQAPRWDKIKVRGDGSIEQRASALELTFTMLRGGDVAERIHVGDKPGWLIKRMDSSKADLVVDGTARTIARGDHIDSLVEPAHEFDFGMRLQDDNATFLRIIDGKSLGETILLPRGALVGQPAWSGIGWSFGLTLPASTAASDDKTPPMRAHVLTLDCRGS